MYWGGCPCRYFAITLYLRLFSLDFQPIFIRLMLLILGHDACRTSPLTGHTLTYNKITYVKLQTERRAERTPKESKKTKLSNKNSC